METYTQYAIEWSPKAGGKIEIEYVPDLALAVKYLGYEQACVTSPWDGRIIKREMGPWTGVED